MNKNTTIWLAILALGVVLMVMAFLNKDNDPVKLSPSPTDSEQATPSSFVSASTTPEPSLSKPLPIVIPTVSRSPFPSVSSQIGATVPWDLLPQEASCTLIGEIKFLNSNTYDNQDALFTYSGIDHPARNIHCTVTPEDNVKIGPNIFTKIPIPNSQSLIGVTLPTDPKYKKYELHAIVDYGRLVDEKGNIVTVGGNVKVSQKQCDGKTTVILP